MRELKDKFCVYGVIKKRTSIYHDPIFNGKNNSFWVDIGNQEPVLGEDPELKENPILIGIDWLNINEICERDRAYLGSWSIINRRICY